MALSPVQNEIKKALICLVEHSRFSENVLAKKIRENAKIEGKKKAGISLADLEKAIAELEEENHIHYSLMMNSANDILIESSENSRPLEGEVRQRRLKSEKSMEIFTDSDIKSVHSGKAKGKVKRSKRIESKKMNIYGDYEE